MLQQVLAPSGMRTSVRDTSRELPENVLPVALEIYARVSDQQWTKQLAGAMAATVDATLVPRLPTLDFSPSQEAAFQELANAFLGANFHGTGRPGSA